MSYERVSIAVRVEGNDEPCYRTNVGMFVTNVELRKGDDQVTYLRIDGFQEVNTEQESK